MVYLQYSALKHVANGWENKMDKETSELLGDYIKNVTETLGALTNNIIRIDARIDELEKKVIKLLEGK